MLMQHTSHGLQNRLNTARRIFSLLPFLVFVLTLMLLATASNSPYTYTTIIHIFLQSTATSLTSSFVSIAAYGFYRYLLERSPGL